MGGDTTTKSPLQGDLRDEGQALERVVSGGKEEGKGGRGVKTRKSNERDNVRTQRCREGGGKVKQREYTCGGFTYRVQLSIKDKSVF